MRRNAVILGAALGLLVGSVTYAFLVADLALAGSLVVVWFAAGGLTVRHWRVGRGGSWPTARWSGAFGGLLALVSGVGVSPGLPLSADVRFALALLVLGTGLAAMQIGVGLTLDAVGLEPGQADGSKPDDEDRGADATGTAERASSTDDAA